MTDTRAETCLDLETHCHNYSFRNSADVIEATQTQERGRHGRHNTIGTGQSGVSAIQNSRDAHERWSGMFVISKSYPTSVSNDH